MNYKSKIVKKRYNIVRICIVSQNSLMLEGNIYMYHGFMFLLACLKPELLFHT